MSTYWRFYYHIVWGTKNREPIITESRVTLIGEAIAAVTVDLEAMIFAIGAMPDHVHLAVAIPPRVAVADAVQRIKGVSSHRVNEATTDPCDGFRWQPGYGAFTFGERSLADVVSYIENQREIHGRRSLIRPSFELSIEHAPQPR